MVARQIECPSVVLLVWTHTEAFSTGSVVWLTTVWWRV